MNKFLIIDDNKNKYEQIQSELQSLGIRAESIKWARSKKSALNYMKAERYFVALLDLNLPEFDDQAPKAKGGFEVLEKINQRKNTYQIPNYIICLSEYKEIREEQLTIFLHLDLSIHDFQNNSWKTALNTKINWALDAFNAKVIDRSASNLISVTIHGIRTQGTWQNQLERLLKNNSKDVMCKNYKYNYFSAIQLLLPFFRKKVIKAFRNKLINLADENPNAKFIFFAHSFGTYILIKALENIPRDVEININRVVLAGCVLRENYDFSLLEPFLNESKIINDCGYNDSILLLSKFFCVDMGMAGRSGFIGMTVNNRYFDGKHDFFYKTDGFIEKYWLPLLNGHVEKIDERNFSICRENLEIFFASRFNALLLIIVLLSVFAIGFNLVG